MAKTIYEMAHDHVVAYMHNDEYEEMQDTYIAGANAVLEQVKHHLNRINVDNHSLEDMEDLYDNLCEMVKNFKGE